MVNTTGKGKVEVSTLSVQAIEMVVVKEEPSRRENSECSFCFPVWCEGWPVTCNGLLSGSVELFLLRSLCCSSPRLKGFVIRSGSPVACTMMRVTLNCRFHPKTLVCNCSPIHLTAEPFNSTDLHYTSPKWNELSSVCAHSHALSLLGSLVLSLFFCRVSIWKSLIGLNEIPIPSPDLCTTRVQRRLLKPGQVMYVEPFR